jgi:RNA polymerase sigma-70 factor (ECF subfamily)
MHYDEDSTDVTLLMRLRTEPTNTKAWNDFVCRYRPLICKYALSFPLQPADAEDVAQNVLLKLVAKMREFHYDATQSFRAWLRTVTRNVLIDFHAERQRAPASGGDDRVLQLLANLEAREALVQQLEEEFDRELFDIALRHVRPRVPASQWEAFSLTALQGRTGAEAAAQLSMLVATVYTAKSKVQKLVFEEVRRLEQRNCGVPDAG